MRMCVARLNRYADAEDAHLLGSAYWVWKQACGDPQNGIGPVGNALMMQDCATGGDAPPKSRSARDPEPRLSAVRARRAHLARRRTGRDLTLAGTTAKRGCGLTVWIPGEAQPDVETEGITDVETVAVPGGWNVTGCADGDYTLSSAPSCTRP